ncbi:MAG: Rrf2 family transcriptional regulator [Planctomycetaceae bacterium]|nr:Rrf2 family transcriptional regulator [Planctomycetaceae bacterium]
MTAYGKVSQAALASMSLLAERYHAETPQYLSSGEIAEARKLSQALVAKVLTKLSQVGLVIGTRGPGGGYALAMKPSEIKLHDVVAPFERQDDTLGCPFGSEWCGTGPECPLHQELEAMRNRLTQFLQTVTLDCFLNRPKAIVQNLKLDNLKD